MPHEHRSLFDAIHGQRAIRHFSDTPVSDEAIETMLHAARALGLGTVLTTLHTR